MPSGVYKRINYADRFEKSFLKTKSCWVWQKADRGQGYGVFWYNGRNVSAHRMSLLIFKNIPLKTSLVCDHLCRNRSCVNPEHLEMVSTRENNIRGNGFAAKNYIKTHCPKGHEYSKENLYIHKNKRYNSDNTYISKNNKRHCKMCAKKRGKERRKNELKQAG